MLLDGGPLESVWHVPHGCPVCRAKPGQACADRLRPIAETARVIAHIRGPKNGCGECHSAQGALAWFQQLEAGNPSRTMDSTTFSSLNITADNAQPQTCVVCHDPHASGTGSGPAGAAAPRAPPRAPTPPALRPPPSHRAAHVPPPSGKAKGGNQYELVAKLYIDLISGKSFVTRYDATQSQAIEYNLLMSLGGTGGTLPLTSAWRKSLLLRAVPKSRQSLRDIPSAALAVASPRYSLQNRSRIL